MAWTSDSLLDDWKRRTGSPLLIRVGIAGFAWITSMLLLGFNNDSLGPFMVGFWLLAALFVALQVFVRARISFLDQYRHPVVWFRFSLWLGWYPSREDSLIEKSAALAASAGAIAAFASLLVPAS